MGIEAEGQTLNLRETFGEQAGARDQQNRERDLPRDHDLPRPLRRGTDRAATRALQRLAQIGVRRAKRRPQTEDQATRDRGADRKQEHVQINRQVLETRARRSESLDRIDRPKGEHHAERTADHEKDKIFHEDLAKQAPAA